MKMHPYGLPTADRQGRQIVWASPILAGLMQFEALFALRSSLRRSAPFGLPSVFGFRLLSALRSDSDPESEFRSGSAGYFLMSLA